MREQNLFCKLLDNLCSDLGIPKNGSRESYKRLKEAADAAGYIDAAEDDGHTRAWIGSMISLTVHYKPKDSKNQPVRKP